MQVIENLKAETITNKVKESVSKETELLTDISISYVNLSKVVKQHKTIVMPKEKVGEVLPWVHIAISPATAG